MSDKKPSPSSNNGWTNVVSAGVSGGLSLLSGVINQQYMRENMAQQHLYEQENMALQQRYQRQNELRSQMYNDPLAVSQRYKAAGMNPLAVMGSGQTNAGLQTDISSAPSASTSANPGGSSMPDLGLSVAQGFQAATQSRLASAQENLLKAQADEKHYQARVARVTAELEEMKLSIDGWAQSYFESEQAKNEFTAAYNKFVLQNPDVIEALAFSPIYANTESSARTLDYNESAEMRKYQRKVLGPWDEKLKNAILATEQQKPEQIRALASEAYASANKLYSEAKDGEMVYQQQAMELLLMSLQGQKLCAEILNVGADTDKKGAEKNYIERKTQNSNVTDAEKEFNKTINTVLMVLGQANNSR